MSNVQREIAETLEHFAFEKRVLLFENDACSVRRDDPRAIVSRVPYLRIERGVGAFPGRRRRLRFAHGSSVASALLRTRELPVDPNDPRYRVQWALDLGDELVPVSWLEHETGELHLLVELASIEGLRANAEDVDPVVVLVQSVIGRPLESLLQTPHPPWVGAEVEHGVRRFLKAPLRDVDEVLRREQRLYTRLGFVESRTPGVCRLPRELARHLGLRRHLLRGVKRRPVTREITDEEVQAEVARVARLVGSRAFATLRFGESKITGLLNPRTLSPLVGLPGARFRLQPFRFAEETMLELTEFRSRGPFDLGEVCLGPALEIFDSFASQDDVYSFLECVLNYVEFNGPSKIMIRRQRSFAA